MLGIDVARAVAVVGMVMVHVGPTGPRTGDLASRLYGLTHGRASILFAVLAGIGVSLLAGARRPTAERWRSVVLRLGWRSLVLLPLGLALQELDHGILVILQYYAVYFAVAAAAVGLSDRLLLALAAGLVAVGPVVYVAVRLAWPGWAAAAGPASLSDPVVQIVRDLLLTGSYPLVTWAGPALAGVWLGRRELRGPAAQARLVAAGAALALGAALLARLAGPGARTGWGQLALADAHSQMPLWLAGAVGAAVATLGVCLLVTDALPRLLWPLAATGQLAFTVYVAHLLVLAAAPDLLRRATVADATASVARFTLVTAAACTAWRAVAPRGPLEVVLRLPWAVRRWARAGAPGRV